MAAADLQPIGRENAAASILRLARLYWAFARVGFINTLAYRLRYYTGVVTYFI